MANAYGNTDGTSNSKFRIVCEYSSTDQNNGYYQYKYRYYIQVTTGNFYSTNFSRSWASSTVSVSGTGKYGYSSYYTKNVAYGAKFTLGSTVYAGYTGSSTYRSEISGSTSIATAPTKTYTVKYNANGGSGAPSSQTKTYGKTLKLSSTKPTRTGYSFQGWATSANGIVAYAAGANYTANAAVTLYAVWKANTYTVSYNANGGTGAPANQTKTYGVNLTLSSTKPTRTNYNFKGWGTSASSTTVAYASGATYSSNSAITLYAIWELAYTAPRITNLTVDRCDSTGTLQDDGTYCRIKFGWTTDKTVSSISGQFVCTNSGGGSDQTWGVSATGTSGSVDQVTGNGLIDTEYSWSFTLTVSDEMGQSQSIVTVPAMTFILDFLNGGKGLAIGKPASQEGFEIGWDTIANQISLVNTKWIRGQLISGSFANIFRMNENDQVELDWTSGGLKGRVMKRIWSGSWSSGSITVSEAPYYNIFLILNTFGNCTVIAVKTPDVTTVIRGIGGYTTGSGNQEIHGFAATTDSDGTTWTMVQSAKIRHDNGGSHNAFETTVVDKIYGVI